MDSFQERRLIKVHKAHYDRLQCVIDSMQGIPDRCACGKCLVRKRAPAEVYDYLLGKRFFTCKEYKDDGLHYRQPWVFAVEEELGIIKRRVEEGHEYKLQVLKLEVQNQELKAKVEKLIARVSELEYAAYGKDGAKEKRKTVGDAVEGQEEVTSSRPPGIKAAKAAKKKKGGQEESFIELKTMLNLKDKLNKQKLLEKLLEKFEPLSEMELSLKFKLMSEML